MTFKDKNERLLIPDGYVFTNISAEGSFLRVEFRHLRSENVAVMNIYLNDFGREVLRTEEEVDRVDSEETFPEEKVLLKKHISRWGRICMWLVLLFYDIREMLCLKR